MKRGLVAVLLLAGCPGPVPCPPLCLETPTPVPSSPTPMASATPTVPVPTNTPPVPSPTLAPPTPVQGTQGSASWAVDISGLVLPTPKPDGTVPDSFAFATGCWERPPSGSHPRPETPCFELALRGTDPQPCLTRPCWPRLGLQLRYSSNLKWDGTDMDPNTPGIQYRPESEMCGQGTKPPQLVPLGPGSLVRVTLEWGAGFVRASTPAGSWTATQGAAGPGFGWEVEPIPSGGIGWTYSQAFTLQRWGGRVGLSGWVASGPPPALGACP